MKHMELKQLFLQDVVRSGELQLVKIPTQMNPSDILTKAVTGPQLKRCLQMLPGLSHHDWPEDEQELQSGQKTSTSLAMLVEVAIEQEQANTGLSCSTRELSAGLSVSSESEGMSPAELVLLTVVTFESAVLAILWCRARCCVRRRMRRSMATQSQTTYTELRGNVNPRFQPLPEHQAGAWEQ